MKVGLDFLSDVAGVSSGATTYMYGFLKALAALPESAQHQYSLFVNKGNRDVFRQFDHPPFNLVVLPGSNRQRELRVLIQALMVPLAAWRLGLDVVDFFGTTGAPALSCAVVQHVKTLHHILVPGQIDRRAAFFRDWAMRASIRRADIVIANSHSTRAAIESHFSVPQNRIVIVPEAVDRAVFLPLSGQDDPYEVTLRHHGIERPYVLFVSTLWPYKNAAGLIRAFSALTRQRTIDHRLVIVGGDWRGELKRLTDLAEGLGVLDRLIFTGHLSNRREVRDIYVGADVFVYPSLCETFGLTLLEAMACGVPVLAADRTAIPETAGDAALLANPDDEPAIVAGLARLLGDDELRQERIAKGFHRACNFTWERTARSTLEAWAQARSISC